MDTPLVPIPDQIIEDVLASRNAKIHKPHAPQTAKCHGKTTTNEQNAVVAQVKQLLIQECNDSTSVFDKMNTKENVLSLYFRNGPGGRQCPGGIQHVSNNFYIQCYEDGSCYYHCLSSECRTRFFLGRLDGGSGVSSADFPAVTTLEETLVLLRDSLAPCRFENLHSLAGAVKSCFGKNSFHVPEVVELVGLTISSEIDWLIQFRCDAATDEKHTFSKTGRIPKSVRLIIEHVGCH